MLLYFSDLLINFLLVAEPCHLKKNNKNIQKHLNIFIFITCDSKLTQHPSVFFNLLTRKFSLHHLYRTDIVVNLINKMLKILGCYLNLSFSHINQTWVKYPNLRFLWATLVPFVGSIISMIIFKRVVLPNKLIFNVFNTNYWTNTSSIFSHNTYPWLHSSWQINIGENYPTRWSFDRNEHELNCNCWPAIFIISIRHFTKLQNGSWHFLHLWELESDSGFNDDRFKDWQPL